VTTNYEVAETWNGELISPGETRDVNLAISESYSGMTVRVPLQVRRAKEPGPTVFVTAALHGDEINGTGAVRRLIQDDEIDLRSGALILVPVLNLFGFDRHSRYLPDRRDLNRAFPGMAGGSLASRMAHTIFQQIVLRCDYGIDLHTASIRRTNYPNIRGDLSDPKVRQIAAAFGCDLICDGKGPKGSLRREACQAGCPTIIMEGGEVWKVQPGIVETAVRGIANVLKSLDMLEGAVEAPPYQITIKKSKWIRAEKGGFMQFHVSPGDIIEKGQPLITNTTLLGHETSSINAPFDAIVIGMTTLPAISPGEPVCHLGKLPKGMAPRSLSRQRERAQGLQERITDELGYNVMVVDPNPESGGHSD